MHHRSRSNHSQNTQYSQKYHAQAESKIKGSAKARIFFPAVIIGGNRLESLSYANHGGSDEHSDTSHDRHGRDGSVPVWHGAVVECHGRDAVEHLADQAGKAHFQNVDQFSDISGVIADGNLCDRLFAQKHVEQDPEADVLGNRCRQAGAVDPQSQAEHKDGIPNHIEDTA